MLLCIDQGLLTAHISYIECCSIMYIDGWRVKESKEDVSETHFSYDMILSPRGNITTRYSSIRCWRICQLDVTSVHTAVIIVSEGRRPTEVRDRWNLTRRIRDTCLAATEFENLLLLPITVIDRFRVLSQDREQPDTRYAHPLQPHSLFASLQGFI